MKAKLENDLLVVGAVTLLLVGIITISPSSVLRIILGLPFLLFFPGYVLIAVLFPRKSDLGRIERLVLSMGLSIAIVPLVGLVLNYTPWGIKLYPILVSLVVFVLGVVAVAWYRRRTFRPEERFGIRIKFHLPSWEGQSRLDKALTVLLAVAILGTVGTLTYVIATPTVGEKFTEFYILGWEGKADSYPREFVLAGDQVVLVRYDSEGGLEESEEAYARLILGIVNCEHRDASYLVRVQINGEAANLWLAGGVVEEIGPIVLEHEERWEQETGFAPAQVGESQKVEFVLYMDGEPYFDEAESPHLWVDAEGAP